ncbi:MAG: sigma-70 family RNA polymerase sigma factor [Aquabacterium sp.]
MDIKAILARIERGDRSAFAELVRHFQRPLFGYLGRMGLRQGQAEEVAQDTFLRAWQHLSAYRAERAEFSTWLFTIARNLALNELGRASNSREWPVGDDLPDAACERVQPPDAVSDTQDRDRLRQALMALPADDRSALALAYFKELDMAAIALIEGCTAGAIKVRLHRAKQRLRQLLEST